MAELEESGMTAIVIRPERPGDEQVIHDLTVAAFAPMSYSDGTEAPIIAKLREDDDLTLSLVAVDDTGIIGHVAFSPVAFGVEAGGGWFGLGPISVRPDCQRQGIGSALVNEGLAMLRARGARGCVLIGDPRYYGRFGFRSHGRLRYQDVPAEYVQFLSFDGTTPSGDVIFAPAFER
jgi:putative acetyltransferase